MPVRSVIIQSNKNKKNDADEEVGKKKIDIT